MLNFFHFLLYLHGPLSNDIPFPTMYLCEVAMSAIVILSKLCTAIALELQVTGLLSAILTLVLMTLFRVKNRGHTEYSFAFFCSE